MGEAKRRKLSDPNYGKIPNIEWKWKKINQHQREIAKPKALKPDYGIFHYQMLGNTPCTMHIEHPLITKTSREAYIHFGFNEYVGTIIVSLSQIDKIDLRDGIILEIIPSPDEKWTTELGDVVLPFRIVD